MCHSLAVVRLVVQQLSTYAVGRRTIPCISNCWARARGLQQIVYFNWGSTCRKVWETLGYTHKEFLIPYPPCTKFNPVPHG